MNYAILRVSNGTYKIEAEGITDINSAKVQYFGLCQTYCNAPDVKKACLMIVDENLDKVEDYKEFIYHEQTEQQEP